MHWRITYIVQSKDDIVKIYLKDYKEFIISCIKISQ